LTLILKGFSYQKFTTALKLKNIDYTSIHTKPTPLNSILWSANVDTENAYLIGFTSFLDSQPIVFSSHPKNHELLGDLVHHPKMQRMIAISKGWYTINKEEDQLYFNDLRFGTMGSSSDATNFVFKYKIEVASNGTPFFIEVPKDKLEGIQLLSDLWIRIKGN
jgi:inner membrane protein